MRNLCEVIEQPVWETSNHGRGKNLTRSDNLNPGDTQWVSVSFLLLLGNMNTIFLRLFVMFLIYFLAGQLAMTMKTDDVMMDVI